MVHCNEDHVNCRQKRHPRKGALSVCTGLNEIVDGTRTHTRALRLAQAYFSPLSTISTLHYLWRGRLEFHQLGTRSLRVSTVTDRQLCTLHTSSCHQVLSISCPGQSVNSQRRACGGLSQAPDARVTYLRNAVLGYLFAVLPSSNL